MTDQALSDGAPENKPRAVNGRAPAWNPARSPARNPAPDPARVVPLRPVSTGERREPLWRDLVGDVLRRERLAQGRTLKEVAEAARISMPYLSEVERGRKEASSEVLAAAAHALGLDLAGLLSRAQGELVRVHSRTAPASHPGGSRQTGSRYGGLCLAA